MEYVIRVNRWGNVAIYRKYKTHIQFHCYLHRSLEWAVSYCNPVPVTIIAASKGL